MAITQVAQEFGQGYIHLTSRQGIEIPFIKLEDIERVKEALEKGGAKPGVCGPRVRTITACQGSAICPNGCIETEELAQELNDRYFGQELPHKFKFGVTGCRNNCLKAEENDLGIKGGLRVEWKKESCIAGDARSAVRQIIPFIEDKETLFRVCDAALSFFKEYANPGERFKFTIDRVGREKLEAAVWEAYRG